MLRYSALMVAVLLLTGCSNAPVTSITGEGEQLITLKLPGMT